MGDYLFQNLPVHLRHIPEPGTDGLDTIDKAREAGYDTPNPVTGVIQVGVEIHGHLVPLMERKAPGVLSDIKRAQQAQGQQQQGQQQPQQG